MHKNFIFETERLIIRQFDISDKDYFFDIMGNPKVMHLIPLEVLTSEESDNKLDEIIRSYKIKSERKIWAIDIKKSNEMIGLCGLIINSEKENEIAYRIREKYWRNGYGTEIAKGLVKFGFEKLQYDLITADAYVHNIGSIKIIEKMMVFDKEFYNQKDKCTDRRYKLYKKDWQ